MLKRFEFIFSTVSNEVDSWNPLSLGLLPRMYRCPIPWHDPFISFAPSKPWIHAVLSMMLESAPSNPVDNRLVDAPVSTMAVPYLYSLLVLGLSWQSLAVAMFGDGLAIPSF